MPPKEHKKKKKTKIPLRIKRKVKKAYAVKYAQLLNEVEAKLASGAISNVDFQSFLRMSTTGKRAFAGIDAENLKKMTDEELAELFVKQTMSKWAAVEMRKEMMAVGIKIHPADLKKTTEEIEAENKHVGNLHFTPAAVANEKKEDIDSKTAKLKAEGDEFRDKSTQRVKAAAQKKGILDYGINPKKAVQITKLKEVVRTREPKPGKDAQSSDPNDFDEKLEEKEVDNVQVDKVIFDVATQLALMEDLNP